MTMKGLKDTVLTFVKEHAMEIVLALGAAEVGFLMGASKAGTINVATMNVVAPTQHRKN